MDDDSAGLRNGNRALPGRLRQLLLLLLAPAGGLPAVAVIVWPCVGAIDIPVGWAAAVATTLVALMIAAAASELFCICVSLFSFLATALT